MIGDLIQELGVGVLFLRRQMNETHNNSDLVIVYGS